MGTVILSTVVSLDGRSNGPDGGIDWQVVGPEVHRYFNDQVRTVDTFLYGRRMYEGMAAFWPTADQDPESSPQMSEYAQLARPMPKLVFSNTPRARRIEHHRRRGRPPRGHCGRAASETRHLLYGGANLAATFMRLDFIDQYWLFINPSPSGAGARCSPTSADRSSSRSPKPDLRPHGGPPPLSANVLTVDSTQLAGEVASDVQLRAARRGPHLV